LDRSSYDFHAVEGRVFGFGVEGGGVNDELLIQVNDGQIRIKAWRDDAFPIQPKDARGISCQNGSEALKR
jgi:hypothetical protein